MVLFLRLLSTLLMKTDGSHEGLAGSAEPPLHNAASSHATEMTSQRGGAREAAGGPVWGDLPSGGICCHF